MSFAQNTSVPIDRTQTEIRKLLLKHGATGFMFGQQGTYGVVGFEMKNRRVKITVMISDRQDKKAQQESRAKWRCLLLVINRMGCVALCATKSASTRTMPIRKAKLECIEQKISTFEEEFLAHIVVPGGKTMGEIALPQLQHAYSNNQVPQLLGAVK